MDKAQNVLKIFCKASGAKINLNKSIAIWASRRERTWNWGQDEGLKWVPEGEGVRNLLHICSSPIHALDTVTSQNRTATLLVVSYNAVGSSPVYYYVFCPNLVLAFRYINEMFQAL
jgi:hypothetical protein